MQYVTEYDVTNISDTRPRKNMITMGKRDTSDLMMIITWAVNISFQSPELKWVSWTHTTPYILMTKVIERTSSMLYTPPQDKLCRRLHVFNACEHSCIMMIMRGSKWYDKEGLRRCLCDTAIKYEWAVIETTERIQTERCKTIDDCTCAIMKTSMQTFLRILQDKWVHTVDDDIVAPSAAKPAVNDQRLDNRNPVILSIFFGMKNCNEISVYRCIFSSVIWPP